jgi:hypothetical protein
MQTSPSPALKRPSVRRSSKAAPPAASSRSVRPVFRSAPCAPCRRRWARTPARWRSRRPGASVRVDQQAHGRVDSCSPSASPPDHCSAVTLRRELLEAILNKTPRRLDDLSWPLPHGQKEEAPVTSGLDNVDHEIDWPAGQTVWGRIAARHEATSLEQQPASALPADCCVITISVSDDLTTLFISRRSSDDEPIVFSLPLDRQGRREGEDEHFSFTDATEELSEIITKSNDTARNAKDVDSKQGKLDWWAERRSLDKRMEELLNNIEFCWLGAFRVRLPHQSVSSIAELTPPQSPSGLGLSQSLTGRRRLGRKPSLPSGPRSRSFSPAPFPPLAGQVRRSRSTTICSAALQRYAQRAGMRSSKTLSILCLTSIRCTARRLPSPRSMSIRYVAGALALPSSYIADPLPPSFGLAARRRRPDHP